MASEGINCTPASGSEGSFSSEKTMCPSSFLCQDCAWTTENDLLSQQKLFHEWILKFFSDLESYHVRGLPVETVGILFMFIMLCGYLRHGGPYLVRMSGAAFITSILASCLFPGLNCQKCLLSHVSMSSWAYKLVSFCCVSYTLGSVFVTSLLTRFWWLDKCNYFRDMSIEFGANGNKRTNLSKIPPVFPNGWLPILESRDLPIGKAKSVSVIGLELAVFRGENGRAYVLDAYCPHLGANIAIGGQVKGSCIECPFHGWTFQGESGRCVSIPYSKKVPEVSKTRSWTNCEVNGFIYIWHHAESDQPTWEIPLISEIANGQWIYKGRTEHTVYCHIQEIPENGADVFHLHQLHSASVLGGSNMENFFSQWTFMKHEWEPNWEPCLEHAHVANMKLRSHIRVFDFQVPLTTIEFNIRQIGPAIVHLYLTKSSFGTGIYVQNIISEGPLKHRIVHHMYSNLWNGQVLPNLYLLGEATMLERDIMIWNNKKYIRNPVLVKEDRLISRYRRWYSQFYSENSPTLKDISEKSLDW